MDPWQCNGGVSTKAGVVESEEVEEAAVSALSEASQKVWLAMHR